MQEDDLSKFLEFLYEDREGFVYVATRDAEYSWNQYFYEWPKQEVNIKNFIKRQSETKDVYVGPALHKTRNALKKSVSGSTVVWVEFDGQEQIDFQDVPHPDLIVQTSTETHLHCYWKVDYLETIEEIESTNRRLTHYLEADSSGWDANQVLRPPTTKNWKHDGLPVEITHTAEAFSPRKLTDFRAAPVIPKEPILLNSGKLENPQELLRKLPLSASLKKKIISEIVEHPYRSSFLMKIGYELAAQKCSHLQIVSLLDYVDDRIGKFKGRKDKLNRLSEIAARALLEYETEEGVPLYSPLDIINHKENLEWIIQGWLHQRGFMILSGAPSVGKTSLGLQLMFHLTTGQEFFEKPISKACKVLFLSLEMSIIELKYFFEYHQKEYKSNRQWDANFRIIDEDASLLDYEEIIENFKPDVVFIDSMSELTREELKESEARAITRWIRKLRRKYSCSFVVIHHNRKDQGLRKWSEYSQTLSDLYGSFIFAKDVDTAVFLERNPEDAESIYFYSLKTRFGRKFQQKLTQNRDTLLFSLKGKDENERDIDEGELAGGFISLDLSGVRTQTSGD